MKNYEPTPRQSLAIREFVSEAITPLIEDVIVKKLGQAMAFLKEQEQTEREWVGLTEGQKDAARWRFLVDNSFDKDGVTQFHVWKHSWEPHSQTGEPTEWKQRVRGPALDRFIDRAIEAKLKEKNT